MTFAGLRDHEDPGISLDIRRLALTGAVTETRRRKPMIWHAGQALGTIAIAGLTYIALVVLP